MSFTPSKIKLGLAVLVLNLLAGSQYAQAACRPSVSGTGSSNVTFALATGAAKASWRVEAIRQNKDARYGVWLKSANRATNCTKSGKVRTCVVSAVPCR